MLGSFEVRTDGNAFANVPGARLRGLLIALALNPGHVVPKATLVDWIWAEHPPSDAANALQRLVSRLRKALPDGVVEGQTNGYRLTVEPDAVDAVRFERLVGQAGNEENPRRVRLLREALALWRGAAMQDVDLPDSAAFDAAVTRLEGLRLTAMEDRFDAEISLGHGVELVTELTDLVAAHPVRERLVAALTEKSLLVAGSGHSAPRYRMIETIKEYAGHRLAEAGESDLARHAHLAHFTELTETAEPHLRRAEQLEWLATLKVEHDNIGSAMRGALAAGEAHAAMRLAAGAGWYWWLGGHRAEGIELITAATDTPGEVTDDVRATVYALVVHFVTSAAGSDEHQAAEWIHKAYRFSRRSRSRDPRLALVAPLERMVRAPGDPLSAWEPLLDHEDPWVRALARLQLGKMRIVLGQDGRDADAYLELALAEFRALGDRFGIWFALTELADRIVVRGEFAGACEHYEQAIAVITEVGAIEDVIWMRSRQAQLYWLLGDEDSSAAAMAEAQRCAERVTWPDALAELALSKAELARWGGDAEAAYRQLGVATAMLGDEAERPNVRAVTQDLLGYLADDLGEARTHRAAACQAASEAGHAPLIARVLVGVADLALRRDQYEQATRLLAASTGVRGLPDRSHPDVARIEQAARSRLGDARFAEAAREGTRTSWSQLVAVTLAS